MTKYEMVPHRTALVNIDMQNAFVEGTPLSAPNGRSIIGSINGLADTCRKAGVLVIHTVHVTREDGSNLGTMGKLIEPVRDGYIKKGSETAKLHPDIHLGPNDIILEKPRYGAFTGTDLDQILRGNGIDSIIITGICTNICCETTAREAGMKDYQVFFTEDGTETFPIGNVGVDEIKRVTLATLGTAFANIVTIPDLITLIETASATAAATE